ncbi:hypothetical protein [Fusobacterium sp.]|uniref:hypothetical protein n=1 Tax=Fusobacterium sp. TaxID=68766 RepID=UPI002903C0F2|nr:hypothetical protein [Fusobacterium sp.]MDU1910390.1 hypothetical protein [Fusobacterium sp.]
MSESIKEVSGVVKRMWIGNFKFFTEIENMFGGFIAYKHSKCLSTVEKAYLLTNDKIVLEGREEITAKTLTTMSFEEMENYLKSHASYITNSEMGAFYIQASQKEIADSEEKRLLGLLYSIKEDLTK